LVDLFELVSTVCKTLDSHSGAAEFSDLLGCYVVSTDKQLPRCRRQM